MGYRPHFVEQLLFSSIDDENLKHLAESLISALDTPFAKETGIVRIEWF